MATICAKVTFKDNYSKGCQSCQQGKWLCIFLTYLCDAECYFCPSPLKQQDKIVSAFGNDPSIILNYIKNRPFNGISFSGGECFLVFDRMIEWLSYFKKHLPNIYFWGYTNGLSVDEKKLEQLANHGLNEIRFNIAATDYNSPSILETIKASTFICENVAVEIPSIPNDYERFIEVLPYLDSINVNYLNLHEYILVPDDPNKCISSVGTFVLDKRMKLQFDKNSLQNTERIKDFCGKRKLNIKINNCSLEKKENQMLHRRLMMGGIFKNRYEKLNNEGLLETYFICATEISVPELKNLFRSEEKYKQLRKYFIHPDKFEYSENHNKGTFAKLSFLPPMSIDDKRLLFQITVLNN